VSFRVDLDRRSAGVAGAARQSPHSVVQELLNRSDDRLWGFVSNGLRLRVLRDNVSLTRQAYAEWDLEAMMTGEAYADFVVLWLVCHQSRVEAEQPADCVLERWSRAAAEQGTRALDQLRAGVEDAIACLGRGYLAHPSNGELRDALRSGELDGIGLYRQLLRVVYRLLLQFVAEDRDLLHEPDADAVARERFRRFYSTQRLREIAERRRGARHPDLHAALRLVWERLAADDGCPELGLPGLGGLLFSPKATPSLDRSELSNGDLLDAVRALSLADSGGVRRSVDFKNLGSEELGSVYESLLELHPEIDADAAHFALTTAGGHERKTTGSYYTPTSLIASLLESALDPVLDEAASGADPEHAILALTVCDPACGSGHFLIAAAHRIAKRLASVRTGDEEPSPAAYRAALRDVVGRCLYGVDVNPMAVELCKVALWMEALEPGRPLGFLDHRVVCGNSLLGATPALIAQGIPAEAFTAIGQLDKRFEEQVHATLAEATPGTENASELHAAWTELVRDAVDDKSVATELRKRNDRERRRQGAFAFGDPAAVVARLADDVDALAVQAERSPADVRDKAKRYAALQASTEHERARLLADAWCTAFVGVKQSGVEAVTQAALDQIAENPRSVDPAVRAIVDRTAERMRFFHWHVAFPDVFRAATGQGGAETAGWTGGFDVVLGNPPWEHTELKETEFFSRDAPEIVGAANKAARQRAIARLAGEDPELLRRFLVARRDADAVSHLIRRSGRFPLCARGRINTYAVFAENDRSLIGPCGRVGCIVPTGIATDDSTKQFFADLVDTRSLVSLYSFWEVRRIFVGTDQRQSFCLLTLTGRSTDVETAWFVFDAHSVEDLADSERRFTLTPNDIALLNPNTRTCPIFRSQRDAEITKGIYRRMPVLFRQSEPDGDPWGVSFRQGLFNMASDSGVFWTREQLEGQACSLRGNIVEGAGRSYLPLYEAKMLHHFDHRYGDYAKWVNSSQVTQLPNVPMEQLDDPQYVPLPRYWVSAEEVEERLRGRSEDRGWLLGWRDIARNSDERTVIAAVLPRFAVGHTLPLFGSSASPAALAGLVASLSSFALDYSARQKVGGTHVTFGLMQQLPLPTAAQLADHLPWLVPRVLELTYTAHDLAPFAADLGYTGPPFRWQPERRFLLRAELDAAFFAIYGVERDDVAYILDTFPIVRSRDEQRYGEYRTKLAILEIYDEMAEAQRSGREYRTRLDPPPADPAVAHDARRDASNDEGSAAA
jgi:hypothetical protein